MTDCTIIGGGLLGMLTARELLQAGARVTILEQGAVGRESSWAGGGILSPLYPWRYADPVTELAHWSQRRYRALAEELAQQTSIDPEWTESGLLIMDTADEAEAAARWATRFGYDLEYLDSRAAQAREPALRETDLPAIWLPSAAQIRNPRLLKAMRAWLESEGVEIRENTRVTGIGVEGERLTALQTDAGAVPSGQAVVCGGAWSAGLLGELAPPLQVEPVRGQMLLFRTEPGTVSRIVLQDEFYVIPRRDGHVLVGSTLEHTGFDKSTTTEARERLQAVAAEIIPALAQAPVERHWAGLRPGAPEGVPFIGPHPQVEGLFVNAGHYRNGVVTGLASARLVADLILGREPNLPPEPYRVGRGGAA